MEFVITEKKVNEDVLIITTFKSKKSIEFFDNSFEPKILLMAKKLGFQSKKFETCFFIYENMKCFLIGLEENYSVEDLRRAYSCVYKVLKQKNQNSIFFSPTQNSRKEICAIIEGLDLSVYDFYSKYKIDMEVEKDFLVKLNIEKGFEKDLKKTLIVNKATKFSRDLVNGNSCDVTPENLALYATKFAKENKLKVIVLDEKKIKQERLNLLYAVGKGSKNKPRLIVVEYLGDKTSKKKIALVGKGITFDTGGYSLKSGSGMVDMKADMGGGCCCFWSI